MVYIHKDSIRGGVYRSDLPYPTGFIPSKDPDPRKRAEHAKKHAKYYSKSEIRRAVKEVNLGSPQNEMGQRKQGTLREFIEMQGFDYREIQDIGKQMVKRGEIDPDA